MDAAAAPELEQAFVPQQAKRHRIVRAARTASISDAGITGGVGWAMDYAGLWVTSNGGASWITATPPHVRRTGAAFDRVLQVQYVDRMHGWVSADDVFGGFTIPTGSPTLRHMEIDRTTDGGRTWRSFLPPGCLESCGAPYLSFLSARLGFALTPGGGLFTDEDGGTTWRSVSRPAFTGAIQFLDPRDGFGVSDPRRWAGFEGEVPVGGGIVYRTSDGGRTWSQLRLRPPVAYIGWREDADSIRFFAGGRGVLAVRFRNPRTHEQRLVVYTSTDAGETWAAHPAPSSVHLWPRQWGISASGSFSAATPSAWVVMDRRVLHVTTDGGRRWRTVRPLDLPRHASIWQETFTSAADGWAIVGLDGGPALIHTTDGGRWWSPLTPPVPKLPRLHPRAPMCGSSCRRP